MRTHTVILSAFGLLRSDPIEWPDRPPRQIILPVFTPLSRVLEAESLEAVPTTTKAVFEPMGYELLPNGMSAMRYELVDL